MSQFITEQLEGNVMSSVTWCSSDGDGVFKDVRGTWSFIFFWGGGGFSCKAAIMRLKREKKLYHSAELVLCHMCSDKREL